MRICLTTTSYQDTPGEHHQLLDNAGFEVIRARGPLPEDQMLKLVEDNQGFDGLLNGDDAITAKVIDAALDAPTPLKVIAKYGIGLDSIDVKHATERKIPVLFTPGVNHTTVAEHAIGLMIAASKHFWPHLRAVKEGQWKRQTGSELANKTLGVLGMGRIGKELIKRAVSFGMKPIAYDLYFDEQFASEFDVERCASPDDVVQKADVVSLHMPLTDETRHFINAERIGRMKDEAIVINTARGPLISEQDVAEACKAGKLKAYAADVLEHEPIQAPHPFQEIDNILITPHVGSRTYESVERQAVRATRNLVNYLNGDKDYIQANET